MGMMSSELRDNAELLIQNTSIVVIRERFHVTSYLRQIDTNILGNVSDVLTRHNSAKDKWQEEGLCHDPLHSNKDQPIISIEIQNDAKDAGRTLPLPIFNVTVRQSRNCARMC